MTMPNQHGDPAELNINLPQSARVYDYWLGGKDNFAADRAVADEMAKVAVMLPLMARESRDFLGRAARYYAAEHGIRQFLDIGTGIPARPNLHETVQNVAADSRVVYVDNDPIVMVHARALLTSSPEGRCAYIEADLREPRSILEQPALTSTLDLEQPVGLTLVSVLMLIDDADEPGKAVAQLRDALPSGSCLAITHPTADVTRDEINAAAAVANRAGMTFVARTKDAVAEFFGDWDLLEPGLVQPHQWRPDEDEPHYLRNPS